MLATTKPYVPGSRLNGMNVSAESRRKAEYIFVEAERYKALGKVDAFFQLLKYAHQIDPTNTAISYYLGYCMLTMDGASNERNALGVSLMSDHFNESPNDYYESYFYGDACTKLGNSDEAMRVWEKMAKLYPTKAEVMGQLADAYGQKKNYTKAIAIYDSIEIAEGHSIPLTVRKISLHLAAADTAGALGEVKRLIKSAPKNTDYYLLMGNLYTQFQKGDSALYYYDKAQQVDPDNGYTYLSKASYYNAKGDSASYDREIYQALINPNITVDDKLNVLTDYSRQLVQEKDSSQRVNKLFTVLIEQHPHEGKIHDLYSQYLVFKKDYKHAAEQLGYVVDLDPADAENWKKLVLVNLMGENYPEAIKASEKALSYNSDNIELYQYVAPAYLQMKQYDKALKVYEAALSKTDSTQVSLRSDLLGGMGDAYAAKGDTATAYRQYEKALDINPGNTMVLNNYAYFLSEQGKDLDKAERMSALTVKDSPDNATFLDTYAWIYFKKRDYKMALGYMKSAIEKNVEKENADLYEHYGDILFMNGQPDKAVEYWGKALRLKPDSDILTRKVKYKTYFYK